MARSAEYRAGFREASKLAVRQAHLEAERMNDPHASRILNNFAFHLGQELKRMDRLRDIHAQDTETFE